MTSIGDIPAPVLDKIKEYAFLKYGVSTVAELKAAIVDERFNEIINAYLSEVTMRILRLKADEAKTYQPTEQELIDALQAKINTNGMPEV